MLRTKLHKIPTHYHPDAKIFSWLAMFISLGNGIFWTLFPLILKSRIGNESFVGYYYTIIAAVGLLVSFGSYKLFTTYSKIWVTKISLIISVLALFLMTFVDLFVNFVLLDVFRAISVVIITISVSLLIRDFTKKADLPVVEGRYYAFANIGWLIGPLISGVIAKQFGNEMIFFASSLAFLGALILFLREHFIIKNPHLHHEKHQESLKELLHNLSDYFKNLELRKVILAVVGVHYLWTVMGIYIPLQLASLEVSEFWIGVVMSLGIIPYLIFEPWVGKRVKQSGVRNYLIAGFAIAVFSVLGFGFASLAPLILISLFIFSNAGAALIEPLKDVYFFEVVPKKDDERFFGIYNSGGQAARVVAPLISSVVLSIFLSINAVWFFTAVILSLIAIRMFSIKKKY